MSYLPAIVLCSYIKPAAPLFAISKTWTCDFARRSVQRPTYKLSQHLYACSSAEGKRQKANTVSTADIQVYSGSRQSVPPVYDPLPVPQIHPQRKCYSRNWYLLYWSRRHPHCVSGTCSCRANSASPSTLAPFRLFLHSLPQRAMMCLVGR